MERYRRKPVRRYGTSVARTSASRPHFRRTRLVTRYPKPAIHLCGKPVMGAADRTHGPKGKTKRRSGSLSTSAPFTRDFKLERSSSFRRIVLGPAPEAIAKSFGNKGHEIRFSKESYRLPFSRQALCLQVLRALGLATSPKKILIADH